jgi:hypothetical protein
LLRAVSPKMKKRLENVVAGMGDLTTYLAQCHSQKLAETVNIFPVCIL